MIHGASWGHSPPCPAAVDPVAPPYSGGTTGLPTGVMGTHRNVCANFPQAGVMEPLAEDDVPMDVLPSVPIGGLTVIMTFSLHRGTTVVTLPRFDMEHVLATTQKCRVWSCRSS